MLLTVPGKARSLVLLLGIAFLIAIIGEAEAHTQTRDELAISVVAAVGAMALSFELVQFMSRKMGLLQKRRRWVLITVLLTIMVLNSVSPRSLWGLIFDGVAYGACLGVVRRAPSRESAAPKEQG
jgi:chromate transport protein ChrA